jgi:Pleckstrin homology domain
MSPTRAIHVIKMLKTGRTFMRLPHKAGSKQKLLHVFLSHDGEYICFLPPEQRKNYIMSNPPKNKVSVSSIKLVQRGLDAGMRRQAAGLSSGAAVDVLQDRLFSIIYSSKNHSLDLVA